MLDCRLASAKALEEASASMLDCRLASAKALVEASAPIAELEPEPKAAIAPLSSPSIAWKAETISVNESKAAGSVFSTIKSI